MGLGLVGVVHTRRWAVQRPADDCTAVRGDGATPRAAVWLTKWRYTRCGGGCRDLQATAMDCARQTACTACWGASHDQIMIAVAIYIAVNNLVSTVELALITLP